MRTSGMVSTLIFSFLQVAICEPARAQIDAVGLNAPDFRALRTMIGPTGTPNLPAGATHQKVAEAWTKLSEMGRDLLLKERDLALVVVDSKGVWLWRSSRIQTLRALSLDKVPNKLTDLEYLVTIIKDDWYQQLRDFFDQSLFTPNSADVAEAFGIMLTRADAVAGATKEEKDWFRGIVGSEIQNLDGATRTALLLHPEEGKRFVEAVAIAEAAQKRQLDAVGLALKSGTAHSILFDDLSVQFPRAAETRLASGRANVRIVGGKSLIEWATPNGTVYLAARGPVPTLPSFDFTKLAIKRMVDDERAEMFFGAHGASSVLSVK